MNMKFFDYKHLPPALSHVSKYLHDVAWLMNDLPNCEEKEIGLRKLLEAKDCFVRAALEEQNSNSGQAE